MARITSIEIAGPGAPWAMLGLDVSDDRTAIGGVALGFGAGTGVETGIVALGCDVVETPILVDGIRFVSRPEPDRTPTHPCGATSIDHVVVMTSSLERTSEAIAEEFGSPLLRVRDAGRGVRQGFHRLGEVIVEIVESPQDRSDVASVWGLVFVVPDLEDWASSLGPDVTSPPKVAVQQGRSISTVRSSVGLGTAVAVMSPHVRPTD